jgi:hypothetical protein
MSMATREEITQFSLEIEKIAVEKSLSYMDAVLFYCEQTGFEVELAAKLVSAALKCKIKSEAEELNFLPKSNVNKLPL